MREIAQDASTIGLRAWKVSEAEEMIGPSTACTKAKELGIQVSAAVFPRSLPMNESYTQGLVNKIGLQKQVRVAASLTTAGGP